MPAVSEPRGLSISFQLCIVELDIFSWISQNGTPSANFDPPTKRNVSMSFRAFETRRRSAPFAPSSSFEPLNAENRQFHFQPYVGTRAVPEPYVRSISFKKHPNRHNHVTWLPENGIPSSTGAPSTARIRGAYHVSASVFCSLSARWRLEKRAQRIVRPLVGELIPCSIR